MKINFIALFVILLSLTQVWAGNDVKPSLNKGSLNDSIIVRFGNKTRMVIYGENKKELEKILKYDLNALLKDLKVRLDSTQQDTTLIVEEFSGNDYLKNKPDLGDDKNYVRIGGRGLRIKNGNKSVTIEQGTVTTSDDSDTNGSFERIGRAAKMYVPSWGSSPRKGFNVSLGLNSYGSNTPMMTGSPSTENAMPDLKPWGSRYISLGYVASTTVATGQKARLHLDFGIDFSWYNLMFQDNMKIVKSQDMAFFEPAKDDSGNLVYLKKSKFTVPYVNLSFMPTISFRKSFISHVSAGAYGGYRIGSYSKTIQEGSKDKKFNRTNFFVNDLRYGLGFELGIRRFPDLFVNYDLNNLYETNRGPAVKMLSFGIKLF
ncbi:hypothetical protein ACFP1I_26965 [Dyadobacter subterraneus]|uniref:Outer membrane protein beta-barrel domain-containing protein n=1 Tax=Dyadobacter subterraneus TaxID=2773304 RepID=A0ABR9WMH3_9BACT|nr:hypothetical protein [Dyadobacter subterraneus]MBE9465576.1 hypothetical protein [Dyadobacter subterraneus]